MTSYPTKPWTNGQIYQVVPGENFQYDATDNVWVHLTNAVIDSDYQVEKTVIETNVSNNSSDISTLQSRADSDELKIQSIGTLILEVESSINGDISDIQSRLDSDETSIQTLKSTVAALGVISDSDALTIQSNVAAINAAYAMLDSDSINIQQLRTDLDVAESAVSTLQTNVTNLQNRADSDETAVQTLRTDFDALAAPVISSSQPTGKANLLWVNLNNGRLYYWNTSGEVWTEIVTGA